MSATSAAATRPWFARLPAIQHAIVSLLARNTHPHFIAYLYLRKEASRAGQLTGLEPHWAGLHDYLVVDGGPRGKPYLRPFWSGPRNAEQEWLNPNLAGSFAGSSLRTAATAAFSDVAEISANNTFALREKHAVLALRSLLYGEPLDAIHLALFLYRNRGIWSTLIPTSGQLVNCFRRDFGYATPEDDDEFERLYEVRSSASNELFEVDGTGSYDETDESHNPGQLTGDSIRHLTAADLGRSVRTPIDDPDSHQEGAVTLVHDEVSPLPKSDEYYIRVLNLMTDYGGIIFFGPSGTGKSYYARRIALTLTDGQPERCRFVQFHPSYQYEDFMEGFRPKTDGDGFELRESHFLELCTLAHENPDYRYVLVIDELSRGDPGRVFGEALTYLELSKRDIRFHLASGKEFRVPRNVLILATMNPRDYGAEQVDAAFDRRFAKIQMDPDTAKVRDFLTDAGMDESLRSKVTRFFDRVNELSDRNPYASLGHTYFLGISDIPSLVRLWDHQLKFNLDKAFPFDREQFIAISRWWAEVVSSSTESEQSGGPRETPDDSGV